MVDDYYCYGMVRFSTSVEDNIIMTMADEEGKKANAWRPSSFQIFGSRENNDKNHWSQRDE
jgi:hypothetical protein